MAKYNLTKKAALVASVLLLTAGGNTVASAAGVRIEWDRGSGFERVRHETRFKGRLLITNRLDRPVTVKCRLPFERHTTDYYSDGYKDAYWWVRVVWSVRERVQPGQTEGQNISARSPAQRIKQWVIADDPATPEEEGFWQPTRRFDYGFRISRSADCWGYYSRTASTERAAMPIQPVPEVAS